MKQLFLLLLCCITFSVFAQKELIGVVVSNIDNEPLIGATVLETGTNNGVFTNYDGSFAIIVSDSAQYIEIDYMGYLSQKIAIGSNIGFSVRLVPDAVVTETVTITVPYGKQTKRSFTGSVSQVKSDQITNSSESSFDKALQGQVPGIVLSSASGQPGASTEIQLRGAGSISAASAPLIVIDGIPIFSGDLTQANSNSNILASINPQDIQSISILKDASATSMYGSRASNGVIMITTKSGKKGQESYTFSTTHGFGTVVKNNFDVLNAEQYNEIQAEAMRNGGMSESQITRILQENTANTNWFDEVFQRSYTQNYEFVAQGGSDSSRYFLSTAYKNESGIVASTDLSRMSLRLNIDNIISPKAKYGVRVNPSYTKQNITDAPGILSSPITGAFLASPTESVFDNNEYNYANGFYNPVGSMNENQNYTTNMRLMGNVYFDYDIAKNLAFKTIANIDDISIEEYKYTHPNTPDGQLVKGLGELYNSDRTSWTSSTTLLWSGNSNGEHNYEILGGFEAESSVMTASNMKASNLPFAGITSLQAASKLEQINTYSTEESMASVFTQAQYNYRAKYYLSASFRTDGSSKFAPNNRWAPFWSVGGSWNLNNESFMKSYSHISLLKLRASYGTSGNANINDYAYLQLYQFGQNYLDLPGSSPLQMGNDSLSWEKNRNLNIGLDFELYKRISTSIEVYSRRTFDLLLEVPVSATTGYSYQIQNVGELSNKGIELSIQSQNIVEKDYTWTSALSFAINRNTIEELYTEGVQDTIIQGTKIRTEGQSLQSFYLPYWAGVNTADGSPMWYDENGQPTRDYNKAAYVLAGSADPKFTAGLSNKLGYKQLSLSFLLYLNYGNLIFNQLNSDLVSDGAIMGKNQSTQILDRWQKPGDKTDVPKVVQNNGSNGNEFSTRYLEDGTYLRLKNIQIQYTVPTSTINKLHLTNCVFTFQVQNPFVWSKFSGMDPETRSNGVYFYDYPKQRVYSAGVSVTF